MNNCLQSHGNSMTVLAPATVKSGAGVLVGSMFGVAVYDAASGKPVEIVTVGVFTFNKDTTVSAFAEGGPVYWDNTNAVATQIPNGNMLIGVAHIVAADGTAYPGALTADTTVAVRLTAAFGDGIGFRSTVNLTSAQIIAMNATPVSVLPAPGAGLALIIESILFEMTTTSTQFTGGGVVTFPYHGGAVATHAGSVPAATVTTTAGTTNTLLGGAVAANGTVVPANTGVDVTNATAAFAAGTGTAKVQVKYRIVAL